MSFSTIAQMMFSGMTKPAQHIDLQEIPDGKVLDLGGGGEGVISRAAGARVIAIDKYLSEVNEARGKSPEAGWMLADATALPYDAHSFDLATAFFSCMYMSTEVKEKVFREANRILKTGGEFWIWDARIQPKSKNFAIRLQVKLPDQQKINTMYGVRGKEQSASLIGQMLQANGFTTEVISTQKHWFMIKATKI